MIPLTPSRPALGARRPRRRAGDPSGSPGGVARAVGGVTGTAGPGVAAAGGDADPRRRPGQGLAAVVGDGAWAAGCATRAPSRRATAAGTSCASDLRDEASGLTARTASCARRTGSAPARLGPGDQRRRRAGAAARRDLLRRRLPRTPVDELDVLSADSEWLGEGRWTRRPLRETAAVDLEPGPCTARTAAAGSRVTSGGTWSTGRHLPDRRADRPASPARPGCGRSSTTAPGAGRSARTLRGGVRRAARARPTPTTQWTRVARAAARRSPPCRSPSPFGDGLGRRRRGADRLTGARPRAPHPDNARAAGRLQRLHEHAHGRPDHRRSCCR